MSTTKILPNISQKFFQLSTKIAGYLIRKIWWRRELLILETPMRAFSKKDQQTFKDIQFKLLNTLPQEEISIHFANHSKVFRKRIEQGLLGWGVFNGTTPIGFLWIATENYYEPALRFPIHLAPTEAYVFDGMLYKEHRQGVIAAYVMKYVWKELMGEGFTTCIAMVNAHNRRALMHHYLLRYKERFVRVIAPMLFGKPLPASMYRYTDAKLTRSALARSKK